MSHLSTSHSMVPAPTHPNFHRQPVEQPRALHCAELHSLAQSSIHVFRTVPGGYSSTTEQPAGSSVVRAGGGHDAVSSCQQHGATGLALALPATLPLALSAASRHLTYPPLTLTAEARRLVASAQSSVTLERKRCLLSSLTTSCF